MYVGRSVCTSKQTVAKIAKNKNGKHERSRVFVGSTNAKVLFLTAVIAHRYVCMYVNIYT